MNIICNIYAEYLLFDLIKLDEFDDVMEEINQTKELSCETMWFLYDDDIICYHDRYTCEITKKSYDYLNNIKMVI